MTPVLLASAAMLLCVRLFRARPLQAITDGLIRLRALGYLIEDMAEGAWSRRYRWQEKLEQARREA